jgi:UDP-2,3-diacylglucosamine pyrophosphatase LpxH
MRLFIYPFIQAYTTITDYDNALRDGTNRFFHVHERDVYFARAKKKFSIPGKAWTDSPYHAAMEGVERRVVRGDPLTVRIDHFKRTAEVEFNEVVFTMAKSLYDRRLKRKIEIIC